MTFAWLECLDSFYVDLIIFISRLGIAGAGAKISHSASIKPSVILDPQAKKSGLLHMTPTPYGESAPD